MRSFVRHTDDARTIARLSAMVTIESLPDEPGAAEPTKDNENESSEAEDYKKLGNEAFQAKDYALAIYNYTHAIQAVEHPSAQELLRQKEDHELQMRESLREQLNQPKKKNEEDKEPPKPMELFCAPPHPQATQIAVYYANRAAATMQLNDSDGASYEEDPSERPPPLQDCNVALLWNPHYAKAYLRRAKLYEGQNKTDLALVDAKKALELQPTPATRALVQRLQKIEDARLEQLKHETMGQLKDLGNSILGNFGLSLDNFEAVQDPQTGSYSISFNQNK